LATDVGPVIDGDARSAIEAHVAAMQDAGKPVRRFGADAAAALPGCFVATTVIEINWWPNSTRRSSARCCMCCAGGATRLSGLIEQINATGYGLTLGLHTRINETIARVRAGARVGNV
jgi:RHH-type proline utilization regulon transcriptional repressor/proline dehydrogenase/delta 1-pyrroline-5-carboxylate dehydrogenase